MTAAWTIPSIDPAFREACVGSLHPDIRSRLLVVDNADGRNRGVAASWNLGIDFARAVGADWLVICSESMRFGDKGGCDLERILAAWSPDVVGGAFGGCDRTCTRVHDTGQGFCPDGYGWHLIPLSMRLVGDVGRFDERFWPAWYEDADYTYRIARSEWAGTLATFDGLDAHLAACEHSVAAGFVGKRTWKDNEPVYIAKHGGLPGLETR